MAEHLLKTAPGPFLAVMEKRKRYEIRVNDRGFLVGDTLRLAEWFPTTGFSGRELVVDVTYMTPGGFWGLPGHLCVMSVDLREDPHG